MSSDEFDAVEEIGQLVDTVDNFLAYKNMPIPPAMKVDAYYHGLEEIRARLRDIYYKMGGTTEWDLLEDEDDEEDF